MKPHPTKNLELHSSSLQHFQELSFIYLKIQQCHLAKLKSVSL